MWKSSEINMGNHWTPFKVHPKKTDVVRAMTAPEGIEDRLRLVAFAELQARDAFLWGALQYKGKAPDPWIKSWEEFARVEDRHAQMLLNRMSEVGADPGARQVSDKLSRLCMASTDPVIFLFLLSSAEERGMESGNILGEQMKAVDPISAQVFLQIASEEVEHVQMARDALAPYLHLNLKEQARAISASLG